MRTRVIWLTVLLLIGFLGIGSSGAQEVENLLVNGGFEDGVMDPWTTYGSVTTEVVDKLEDAAVKEDPIEGNYCLHIVVPEAGANFWDAGLQHRGHNIFEQGKKYTLSAFLKCSSGTLNINFKPEQDGDPWPGYGEQSFTMTEEWTEFSTTTPVFSEEVNPASVTFHIQYAAGDFWIDGVRWYEGDYVEPYLGEKSLASRPVPEDGSLHPDTWVNLSWKPGDFAVSHDVYFSDNFDLVNDGAAEAFRGKQREPFFVVGFPGFPYPEGLIPGTTYYWRIDEVNDLDPNSPWKGPVWSFGIPPKTAYAPDPADAAEQVNPGVTLGWMAGFGAKLHTVYFGENFDDVNNATGGLPQGTLTYPPPGTLKLAKTYYWRVDEFDIIETHKGNVWSFTTEGAVAALVPANGAVDVKRTQIISFSPSVFAASHEVYFGTDKDAVKNADTGSPEYKGTRDLGAESYDPGKLELGVTYYWRVDEVNDVNPDSPWPGILWSFTTAGFLVVDDFESYNDLDPAEADSNRIFNAWIDGYDDPTNGSLVGYDVPPFAEQTIVHGGDQSMPFFYDNSVGYSEATLTLTYPRDWTEDGVSTLSIWFRGNSDNAAEQLYVALNGSAVVNHDKPDAAQTDSWTEWTIDLQAFTDQGVNLTNIDTISLGLGNKNNPLAGGSGTIFFDDIRLYRPTEPAP